jgi:hypothetical protein
VAVIYAYEVEFLVPAALPAPEPSAADPVVSDKSAKRKSRGERVRSKIWDDVIFPCLAAKVERAGRPFADLDAAIDAARECVRKDPKKRFLHRTNISRGMQKWCPAEWLAVRGA